MKKRKNMILNAMKNAGSWFKMTGFCLVLYSCGTSQAIEKTTVSEGYDENRDITTVTINPHGNLVIPGRWEKIGYNENSTQHFFMNEDSVTVSVSKNPLGLYPFYEAEMAETAFVNEYFKWDSAHLAEAGYETEMVREDPENKYVIWRAHGEGEDNLYLYGAKGGYGYGFMHASGTLSEEERIRFLEDLYLNN